MECIHYSINSSHTIFNLADHGLLLGKGKYVWRQHMILISYRTPGEIDKGLVGTLENHGKNLSLKSEELF